MFNLFNRQHKSEVYAPICLFVYNRLEHPKRVIEHLLKTKEAKFTDLFVFQMAPGF